MLTALFAVAKDLRYGARNLRRSPLFSVAAVVSLGLAIGGSSAMFSLFDAVLWQPMAADRADSVVKLYSLVSGRPVPGPFSYPDYRDYANAGIADTLAAYTLESVALGSVGQDTVTVWGEAVTGNYFDLLKPRMHLGRGIRPEEGTAVRGEAVAVLGYGLWERRFGADAGILGRKVRLNGEPFTVVGVAAREFKGAYSNLVADELWVPVGALTRWGYNLEQRGARYFFPIGRLRPGKTVAETQAAARAVAKRLAALYPDTNRGVQACAYLDADTQPVVALAQGGRAIARGFLVVAGLVLLIACANVANLLLGRATTRRREIATRLALGATRAQLVRQLLAESFLLSLVAGAFGLLVGVAAGRLLALLPVTQFGLPLVLEARTDMRVVFYTLALSLGAGVVFGLLPALRAARADLVPAIKGSDVGGGQGRTRRFTLSRVLVVGQIATSLLLLVLSGLFARSINGALSMDPGFRTDNRLVVQMVPSLVGYDGERATAYYRAILERLEQAPSIRSASLTQHVPLGLSGHSTDVAIEGRAPKPGEEKVETRRETVDENYFRTLGVRLVAGRAFDQHDNASSRPVVIVNETFARRYWPGRDALGKRLQINAPTGPWLEVVGVAADGKYEAFFEPQMTCIWLPYRQHPRVDMSLVAEARGDTTGAASALRRQIAAVDANVPVFAVKTMKQHLERQQVLPTLLASLVVPAGVLAMVIAVIGLYAVMAYSVGRRTREIGIRVAIGAAPGRVLRLVLREGIVLTAGGMAVGLGLAFTLTRLVSAILTGVSPTDPLVFAAVPTLLLVVAALACYVPARRALGVDPLIALKQE